MKRYRVLCLFWVGLLFFAACSAAADIPPLRQLAGKTPAEIGRLLEDTERDALLRAWGEPDGMLFGAFGDVWYFEGETESLTVYYDADARFREAKVLPID